MMSPQYQEKIGCKNLFYSNFINIKKRQSHTKYLFVIKKPHKIITWFTTNPYIAEFASRNGLIVTCKTTKSRIFL